MGQCEADSKGQRLEPGSSDPRSDAAARDDGSSGDADNERADELQEEMDLWDVQNEGEEGRDREGSDTEGRDREGRDTEGRDTEGGDTEGGDGEEGEEEEGGEEESGFSSSSSSSSSFTPLRRRTGCSASRKAPPHREHPPWRHRFRTKGGAKAAL